MAAQASSPLSQMRADLRDQLDVVLRSLVPATPADEAEVGRLQPIVERAVASLQDRLDQPQGTAAQRWADLADIARRTEQLASETLAFVGGIEARRLGLDGGMCNAADVLIAAVSTQVVIGYVPITVPAANEYLSVMSDVIRVRYPGNGIWDLPVALHEFGHYLVPRITPRAEAPPVRKIIETAGRPGTAPAYFAEELWADTFAAYVGGPAYACTLVARLDPTSAHRDQPPTHPSAMKRATAVFVVLDALQEAWQRSGSIAGDLDPFVSGARARWRERLESAGEPVEPTDEHRTAAETLAREYLAVLDGELSVARYDDARRATDARDALVADEVPPSECTLLDLLNGAWSARRVLEQRGRGDKVAHVASTCANIALHGAQRP